MSSLNTMLTLAQRLEMLSAISSCNVKSIQEHRRNRESQTDLKVFSPHDFTNLIAVKSLHAQDGSKEFYYPDLGLVPIHHSEVAEDIAKAIADAKELEDSTTELDEAEDVAKAAVEDSTGEVNEEVIKPCKRCVLLAAPPPTLYVDEDEFFEPQYDCDFTNITDEGQTFKRGDEEYKRPLGWKRMALKVFGKYDKNNHWLRTGANAWPVSYLGTSEINADGIIKGNYKAGPRKAYGRGVYSTPDIHKAERYATTFTSKTDKKKYRVVLQNRINPKNRVKCSREGYWLVPVSVNTPPEEECDLVRRSLRPYGYLYKEV